MSGADDNSDTNGGLLGFEDEFIADDGVGSSFPHRDGIFAEADNRFEPSFDTLPIKIQQQALSRLEILKYVEKKLEGGWSEANLVPLLQLYKEKTGKKIPCVRTLNYWKAAYFDSGRNINSLVPKFDARGHRPRKNISKQLVDEAIAKIYLTDSRLSVAQAYEYYERKVNQVNRKKGNDRKIEPIKLRTFYNRVNELPPYDVAVARFGKAYADRKFRKVSHIIPATYPMEYVEIDHTTAPVMVVDDELGLPLGRPHLTILYDRYSTCIVGLYVTYRHPSYDSVRAAFLNAILKKDWVKDKYPSIKGEWPCYGKITYLVVDNGAEFWSKDLESGLKPLVTDILFTKAAKPWEKPHVEKSFDTFYKMLFSRFPGKTFNNIGELEGYDPKQHAVVNVSLFLELLHEWLIDYFHMKSDSRLYRIPYYKWFESKWRPNFYENEEVEQLKIELGKYDERTLQENGINIHNLTYNSDDLVDYKKRSSKAYKKGALLKIKSNPDDLSHIYVYMEEENKYLKVPVVKNKNYIEGVSLYQYQRIQAANRLNNMHKENKDSLSDTYFDLNKKLDERTETLKNTGGKRLPKTTNLSIIARYQNVGSEGPGSIVTNKEETNNSLVSEDIDDYLGIDYTDIDGY